MSETTFSDLQRAILAACLANSHGDYEYKWINGPEQKAAVTDLVKQKLIARTMGDGTAKGFTSRLQLTLRGRTIAEKLRPTADA